MENLKDTAGGGVDGGDSGDNEVFRLNSIILTPHNVFFFFFIHNKTVKIHLATHHMDLLGTCSIHP